MNITVIEDANIKQPEITIRCRQQDGFINDIIAHINLADCNISGIADNETHLIPLKEILYFETVDGKTFFYTADSIFETELKLYQLEQRLVGYTFSRISKSVIANLKKLKSIKPQRNSRLCATLVNGEKLMVSRKYLYDIKERLGV